MAVNYNFTPSDVVGAAADSTIPGWIINLLYGMGTLTAQERKQEQQNKFDEYAELLRQETVKNDGKPLTKSQLKDIFPDWKMAYNKMYDEWYDENKADFTGDALAQAQQQQAQQSTYSIDAFINMMNEKGLAPQNLSLGDIKESGLNAEYEALLAAQNAAVNQQYAAEMQELDRAESDMYRSIGMSQRMMERDIAKRRQQALKSGMSTAQLAAQEQQNILAAQTGAAQIAQQYADQRYGAISQFAGANAQNYANVLAQQQSYGQQLQQFNAQQQANWANTLASVYAQNYTSDKYDNQYNTK